MSSFRMSEHERLVLAFMDQQRTQNPERYRNTCNRYPTKGRKAMMKVKQKEITVGLLGLQPETGLSNHIARQYGFEVGYVDE